MTAAIFQSVRLLARRLLSAITVFVLLHVALGAQAAPNVVLILADDLGFSDLGCYGSEIETPNLDRLAAEGVRLTQMYNTGRCWPTRASILTGYYPQQVNRDPAARRPAWATLLPALLKEAGYRSYHAGKWHVDGPVLAGGFDRSYRFEDWDRYFTPAKHFLDDEQQPPVSPSDNYYATDAIADHSIKFLADHAGRRAESPFFLYLAFVAPHFPLHARSEDIDRYRGRYAEGWDEVREARWKRLQESGIVDCALSERDSEFTPRYLKESALELLGEGEIPHAVAWKDLTPAQQRFQAAKMEIHAAMVFSMDRAIGRVFQQLAEMNAWDDTLIIFLSDNGADASILVRGEGHDPEAEPGSARSFLCLGPGWASAANSPFRRHKIWMHEGGNSTPCIIRWPGSAEVGGALRHSPAHVIDILPTLLELAGIEEPASNGDTAKPPLPGRSLVPLRHEDVELARDYLYWHHEGNRALRVGDWKLVSESENDSRWELYNLRDDRAESNDLSSREAERVAEMSAKWQEVDATFRRQSGRDEAPATAD